MLRHLWRGVRQLWEGGETAFHSFLFQILGQFIKGVGYSGLNYRFSGVLDCCKIVQTSRQKLGCGLNQSAA